MTVTPTSSDKAAMAFIAQLRRNQPAEAFVYGDADQLTSKRVEAIKTLAADQMHPAIKAADACLLMRRFEALSDKMGMHISDELRPAIFQQLLGELDTNQKLLSTDRAAALVPATIYSGAIAPELRKEFPDAPRSVLMECMLNLRDPRAHLATRAELLNAPEFVDYVKQNPDKMQLLQTAIYRDYPREALRVVMQEGNAARLNAIEAAARRSAITHANLGEDHLPAALKTQPAAHMTMQGSEPGPAQETPTVTPALAQKPPFKSEAGLIAEAKYFIMEARRQLVTMLTKNGHVRRTLPFGTDKKIAQLIENSGTIAGSVEVKNDLLTCFERNVASMNCPFPDRLRGPVLAQLAQELRQNAAALQTPGETTSAHDVKRLMAFTVYHGARAAELCESYPDLSKQAIAGALQDMPVNPQALLSELSADRVLHNRQLAMRHLRSERLRRASLTDEDSPLPVQLSQADLHIDPDRKWAMMVPAGTMPALLSSNGTGRMPPGDSKPKTR